MLKPPLPDNESERLAAVQNFAILDTPPEERFDRITKLATALFNVPISTVTIMDTDREWYKSCRGVVTHEEPRVISFCAHVVASQEDALIIKDTKLDPRFADNPMVIGSPYIRFYAGVPIYSLSEEKVGVFCIKDIKPRDLSDSELFLLRTFASWAEIEVNIISLKKIFNGGGDKEALKPILNRLAHRNVTENLKSIKFGLKSKSRAEDSLELKEEVKALEEIEELILKIQKVVAN